MTVKFSRSIRSIQADNLVPVLVGIGFFTLLMIGWILWLFLAQIPTYATSSAAAYHNEGYVLAQFPPTTLAGIRRGQPARFHLATVKSETQTIPLVVSDVVPETGQVRLVYAVNLVHHHSKRPNRYRIKGFLGKSTYVVIDVVIG